VVVEGRRERKKQRTRDLIIRVAMDQFLEHGFDGATIADIAEAADIATRTFWLHFPSKEAVVFSDVDEHIKGLTDWVEGRDPSQTILTEIRPFFLNFLQQRAPLGEMDRRRLIRETPSLLTRERMEMARVETVLISAIAADLGDSPSSLRPRLVAASLITAFRSVVLRYDAAFEAGTNADPQELAGDLDDAFVFLEGGLESLTGRMRQAVSVDSLI
jgi:AcrR family transcriptional regulator